MGGLFSGTDLESLEIVPRAVYQLKWCLVADCGSAQGDFCAVPELELFHIRKQSRLGPEVSRQVDACFKADANEGRRLCEAALKRGSVLLACRVVCKSFRIPFSLTIMGFGFSLLDRAACPSVGSEVWSRMYMTAH